MAITVCIDPAPGLAGNMLLGALLDAGASLEYIEHVVRSTGLAGFTIRSSRTPGPHGIASTFCEVRTEEKDPPHRHLPQILELVESADAPRRCRERAAAVFVRLAEAEAAVHGVPPSAVHFHEVGAADAVVDILGVCAALEDLDVETVSVTSVKTGRGTVTCAHGVLPVPAPATVKLLEGLPVSPIPVNGEVTTPTGAALVSALARGACGGGASRLVRTGMARGAREFPDRPNLCRVFLQERAAPVEGIQVLETDIDDCEPEVLAALPDRLRQAGALDAVLLPTLMKKGRPGTRLSVIAPADRAAELANLIFRESSTTGIRRFEAFRFVLPRRETVVETPWGPVRAKEIRRPDCIEITPEFDSADQVSRARGVPLREVMLRVRRRRPGAPPSGGETSTNGARDE